MSTHDFRDPVIEPQDLVEAIRDYNDMEPIRNIAAEVLMWRRRAQGTISRLNDLPRFLKESGWEALASVVSSELETMQRELDRVRDDYQTLLNDAVEMRQKSLPPAQKAKLRRMHREYEGRGL